MYSTMAAAAELDLLLIAFVISAKEKLLYSTTVVNIVLVQ